MIDPPPLNPIPAGQASTAARAPDEMRGLAYPCGRWVPGPGEAHEVAPGVLWVRMGLPFGLDHINLWVLDDGDGPTGGWVIVDTGVGLPASRAAWEALFAGPLAARPVTRVLVTHYHPDHIGMAGWLTCKWGVPLEITRTEYLLARTLTLDVRDAPPDEAIAFSIRAGWSAAQVAAMKARAWGSFGRIVSRLPAGFKRLRDGDAFTIGTRRWQVVVGRGHAPEHACLVADDLMIAGDQVLPRITSNVSVYPTEPYADPLADWLDSIERLRGVPADVLVLPAHNEPFVGLHTRLDQLAADHATKLERLEDFCAEPRTAVDCFAALFRKPIGDADYGLATGETVAHLHWLEMRGRVRRISDAGGVDRFARA